MFSGGAVVASGIAGQESDVENTGSACLCVACASWPNVGKGKSDLRPAATLTGDACVSARSSREAAEMGPLAWISAVGTSKRSTVVNGGWSSRNVASRGGVSLPISPGGIGAVAPVVAVAGCLKGGSIGRGGVKMLRRFRASAGWTTGCGLGVVETDTPCCISGCSGRAGSDSPTPGAAGTTRWAP